MFLRRERFEPRAFEKIEYFSMSIALILFAEFPAYIQQKTHASQ